MTIYFIKPVQIDSTIEIQPRVLDVGRKFGKVDVEVFNQGKLVGKALLTCQLLDRVIRKLNWLRHVGSWTMSTPTVATRAQTARPVC